MKNWLKQNWFRILKFLVIVFVLLITWGFFNIQRENARVDCYVHFKTQDNVSGACDSVYSIKHILLNFGWWR